MCAVFPHCRPAGFAAEQSRKNIGVYMVWAVLAGLDFSGVECLLCLFKQFLGDNRLVHTFDNNPIFPVIFRPLFCAVGCVYCLPCTMLPINISGGEYALIVKGGRYAP